MDRRSLIFIVLMSFTLFAVNIFFQNNNANQKKEWLAQQEVKKQAKEKQLEQEIKQRTATPSKLPLTTLYADKEAEQFLAYGILTDNHILTLSWTENLPERIFVIPTGGTATQELILQSSQTNMGSPTLYGPKDYTPLTLESLSRVGNFDLQLVSFNHANRSVEVTLGEYTDGYFVLPKGTNITSLTDGSDTSDYTAIALLKTLKGYIPVGFYNPNQNILTTIGELSQLSSFITIIKPTKVNTQGYEKAEEQFYVLENAYQQLVFSNFGGALAEVNLPFKSKKDDLSVVREIEFDRVMVEKHPYNAMFPSRGYFTPSNSPDSKNFEWHEQGQLGGYYPLLRRDLIEDPHTKYKTVRVEPNYYALNIVSDHPELARFPYEVKEFTDHSITFEAIQNFRRITKTYSLDPSDKAGPYSINLEVRIEGESNGLWMTTGIPEIEWISGNPAPVLKYRITRNNKPEVLNIELPKDTATVTSIYPDWICNSNGFLGTILDPLTDVDPGYRVQQISGLKVPSRLTEIDQEYDRFKAENLPGYMTLLPLKSKPGVTKFRFFAGPFDGDILNQVDAIYSDKATGYNPDYIACQTMHGWFTFISEPFAQFLLVLLKFFHYITHSWAFSIVLLTVCLRLILYPLNTWSTKSMVRMQMIAPEVTAIQERYKKDPKKAQMEIITLYREKGINPASGCVPMLIQMPFLIGMFDLLKSSFALRGAPFIPGWIDDLTAPDVLFSWNYPIFFIGTAFHLLPILLGLVMFIQQKFFSNSPTDPKMMTDQQRQQKAMGSMMAVVFAIMFYHFPSGLNIYWLSSMLLGMLQQWYTTKKMKNKQVVAAASAMTAKKKK